MEENTITQKCQRCGSEEKHIIPENRRDGQNIELLCLICYSFGDRTGNQFDGHVTDCSMCGNMILSVKRNLPFENECKKCKYTFTFVYKNANEIKATRPKPPRVTIKTTGRGPIPQDIMDAVWNRDGGQCVKCNSNQDLEFDHMIPLSKGGSNRYRNLQLLCVKCNRSKSDNIG